MRRRISIWTLLLALFAAPMVATNGAVAEIEPPWCGTPEPDAAEALPDGTDPSDPPGSFPHIPYYAIGCTLDSIEDASGGRMTVEVIGQSGLGRDMYLVAINALDTAEQRRGYSNWRRLRKDALTSPAKAQKSLRKLSGVVKVPIYIQAGIHGNEYEGVDAAMELIEDFATTPYGADPEIDDVLDHAILLFNVIQNPDGRVAGTRANSNGFDMNRDFLTQSQGETLLSVEIMQEWLPTQNLDLHGYATPTLVDGTTKPHNPGIEYDLFVKWNQPRLDANEAALDSELGQAMQRPVNDWCENADLPPPSGICPGGTPPGPAVAEGWDDWGPFYTATYMQLTGIDASTVEMCRNETDCGGRAGARDIQYSVSRSTMDFTVDHREDMLLDQLEVFRRGVADAARVDCCPPPIVGDHNWMTEYPRAYVIPLGEGQRSDPEANRLVEWLLFNGIEVGTLRQTTSFGGQTFQQGSYVVFMDQALRGIADTALSLGTDITDRINTLYAPPAAWSHGFLWGAEVVTIPRSASFSPATKPIGAPTPLPGGVEPGPADSYALEIDSATAVRALNGLLDDGVSADVALAPFTSTTGAALPAGTAVFPASEASALNGSGQQNGLLFHAVSAGGLPPVEPIEGNPRIAVLTATGAVNQDLWSLLDLGFDAVPVATAATSALNDPAAPNPLEGVDVVYNTGGWPTGATARSRLTAFFDDGGGYIGVGTNGANFLSAANSGQLPGLATTSATPAGVGQSGIFHWSNIGGQASNIVGTYPAQDTAIMDPITWFTSVPATATLDGRLLASTTDTFASGLWRLPRDPSAGNAPIIIHGDSTDGVGDVARITAFSMNPLYRADPEREWPMVAGAAYWADQ